MSAIWLKASGLKERRDVPSLAMKNLLARDLIPWFGGWFRPETSQAALSDHDRLHKALAMLNCREPAAKSGVLLKV